MDMKLDQALVAGLLAGVLWAVVTGCQRKDDPPPDAGAQSIRTGQGYSPYVSAVGNGNIDPYGVSAGGWKTPQ